MFDADDVLMYVILQESEYYQHYEAIDESCWLNIDHNVIYTTDYNAAEAILEEMHYRLSDILIWKCYKDAPHFYPAFRFLSRLYCVRMSDLIKDGDISFFYIEDPYLMKEAKPYIIDNGQLQAVS